MENGPFIVDLPINSMVDLSIVFGMFTRGYNHHFPMVFLWFSHKTTIIHRVNRHFPQGGARPACWRWPSAPCWTLNSRPSWAGLDLRLIRRSGRSKRGSPPMICLYYYMLLYIYVIYIYMIYIYDIYVWYIYIYDIYIYIWHIYMIYIYIYMSNAV